MYRRNKNKDSDVGEFFTAIRSDMCLSGEVDEKMLDTLREVEVSELRRGGGQQHPQHIGSRTKSRRYRRYRRSWGAPSTVSGLLYL